MDMFAIRMKIFEEFNIPVENPQIDPPHEILMRAHYSYIFDLQFDHDIEEIKKKHEKEIGMLLENITYCTELEERYNRINS